MDMVGVLDGAMDMALDGVLELDMAQELAMDMALAMEYWNRFLKQQTTIGEKMEKTKTISEEVIGKYVIVRANVAGVHAGEVVMLEPDKHTIMLKNARRLWRIYTRDKTGSVSDVAANGLKDGADHSIGVTIPSVTITNPAGLEIAEMTDKAWESVRTYLSE